MTEIKFTKLKSLDGYNVEIGEHVVGRFAPFSPQFSFEHLVWLPKIKHRGISGGYARAFPDKKLPKVFSMDTFVINGPAQLFTLDGKELFLSKMEFNLMYFLASNRGQCVTRSEIEIALWNETRMSNLVDVHMKNLRNKIRHKVTIETVRGIGYRLR